MTRITRTLLLAVLLWVPIILHAEDGDISIEDFSFLTGYWSGEGFGGDTEEMWMPAVDGKMFGIFKQSSNNELVFSEFMEISEVDGKFQLRLKHFNPDFSGWEDSEEHVIFSLRSVATNAIIFDGLSYELTNANHLKIEVSIGQSDGSVATETFNLSRTDI